MSSDLLGTLDVNSLASDLLLNGGAKICHFILGHFDLSTLNTNNSVISLSSIILDYRITISMELCTTKVQHIWRDIFLGRSKQKSDTFGSQTQDNPK